MTPVGAHQMIDFLTGIKHGDILTKDGVTEAEAEAARKKFLDASQKGIRDQIEITLPLIYLITPYNIASYVKRGLIRQSLKFQQLAIPEKPADYSIDEKSQKRYDKAAAQYESKKASLAEFIISIKIDGVDYYPGDIEYHQALYNTMREFPDKKVGAEIMAGLQSKYSKKIKFEDLVATATKTLEFITVADGIMADGIYSGGEKSQEYINVQNRYRKVLQEAGNEQFQWLTKNTPAQFENPESFITNYDPNKDFLIVTPKFKSSTQGGRDIPNELSRPIIVNALRSNTKHGILTVNENFSVGAFAAAGHTGATTQEEPGGQLMPVGINLPMRQAAYLFATSQSKFNNMQALNPQTFVANTKHLDLSVQFNKNVSGDVKTLFSAMFSIARTMRASYNSEVLSHQETAYLTQQLNTSLGKTYRQIGEEFNKRFFSPEGMEMAVNMRFSPSIKESTAMLIMHAISGGKMPKAPARSSVEANSKGKSAGTTKTKVQKAPSASKFSLPKSSSAGSSMTMSEQPTMPTFDLVNLRELINSQLQDVISANMGDGKNRNILNYRTGRFASSAKVESISSSRQGMITAFYSYMKNPYATFSAGGKQSLPKSRDPKLLISKSIREIAQQIVSNKMRAVSL
jgi:hypothetical protein